MTGRFRGIYFVGLAARAPPSTTPYTNWDRARLSVVVPIGVIVAVAIVCIVVAVLSSAQRADEVAVDARKAIALRRAQQLRPTRAARSRQRRLLATARSSNIRHKFDPAWADQRAGAWLAGLLQARLCLRLRRPGQAGLFAWSDSHAADKAWFEQRAARTRPSCSTICAAAARPCPARSGSARPA